MLQRIVDKPDNIDLDVTYFSQIDNQFNPHGSCNVTSIAMCLWSLGIRGDGSHPQLEDQLYQACEYKGLDRHSAQDLKKLVELFPGCHDDFTEHGTLDDIRMAISAGKPCIVHGYFTRSGHIIVIRGFDKTGFIVNDPYGEYFAKGYDTCVSGKRLHYSTDLIARVCSPESVNNPKHIWLHRIWRSQ